MVATGLESDAEDDEAAKKGPQKGPYAADLTDVIAKSRNMNAQVKRRKKDRIYETQLSNDYVVRPKMLEWFSGFRPEESEHN